MATGTVFQHDTTPTVRASITQGGSALDITDYDVSFLMTYNTTLQGNISDTVTTILLPEGAWNVVESGDSLVIDDERMQVTSIPSEDPGSGNNSSYNVTRGYTIPSVAGKIYASTMVAGTGTNIFVTSSNASFTLNVDASGVETVTLASSATSSNTLISHLVTDLQAAVDSVCTPSTATVGNVGNRLHIISDTTGIASSIVLAGVDTVTTSELGFIATTDYGESSVISSAANHKSGVPVYVIKVEADARIQDASGGVVEYEWSEGDTNRTGTYNVYFGCFNTNGKYFQIPTSSDYTIQIVRDPNNRNIKDGV